MAKMTEAEAHARLDRIEVETAELRRKVVTMLADARALAEATEAWESGASKGAGR